MKRALIFFVTTPLIKRDLELYGVNYFESKGFNVYFLNFWALFSPNVSHKLEVFYENEISLNHWITAIKVIRKFQKEKAIFISDVGYASRTFILFVILTLLNVTYQFVDNWDYILPPPKKIKLKAIFSEGINSIIKKAKRKIDNKVKKFIFLNFLKKPHLIFWPNKSSHQCRNMLGKKSINIPYCSYNYDIFLETIRSNFTEAIREKEYFVFLDQYLSGHPDLARSEQSPVSSKYYESLNAFFERLSRITGMLSIIACHPRRDEGTEIVFTSKEKYYNKTPELIKCASLVVAHDSTALELAILWHKPILLIATNELINKTYYPAILARAEKLHKKIYNIDEELSDQAIESAILMSKDIVSVYENYIEKYIVYESCNSSKTYEIIYDKIKDI